MVMAATSDVDVPRDEEFTLLSNDKKPFVVSRGLLRQSTLISNLFRDLGLDGTSPTIPLNNVSGSVLEKVVEWSHLHKDDKVDDIHQAKPCDPLDDRDVQFYSNIDQPMLFDLVLAANYMDIKPLLESSCKSVADMIKGKTSAEIRTTFNIVNDLSKDEEEQIMRENAWCEESLKKSLF